MPPFDWSPFYETGIPRVDREHRELFRCVRSFEDSCAQNEGRGRVEQTIHYLHHYAMTHFNSEEDQMRRAAYPGLEPHRAEHEKLLTEIRGMMGALHQARGVSLVDFSLFIRRWIADHILKRDMEFARWLRTRGAEEVPLESHP